MPPPASHSQGLSHELGNFLTISLMFIYQYFMVTMKTVSETLRPKPLFHHTPLDLVNKSHEKSSKWPIYEII
jgi:hypothetical protein